MTQKEIIEGKKIISEYMGGKEVDWFSERVIITPWSDDLTIHNYIKKSKAYILDVEIKYDTSWDWLMDVINKINEDFNYTIPKPYDITKEFGPVVEFIKWIKNVEQK
jgi:hypothetical protein